MDITNGSLRNFFSEFCHDDMIKCWLSISITFFDIKWYFKVGRDLKLVICPNFSPLGHAGLFSMRFK